MMIRPGISAQSPVQVVQTVSGGTTTRTERLDLEAELASFGWSYDISRLRGDAATGDNVPADRGFPGSSQAWARWSFVTPSGQLTGTQTFRVRAKASSTAGAPKIRVRVFESGTQKYDCGTVSVTTAYQTFSFTWSPSVLSDQSGANVELRLDFLDGTPGQGFFSVDAVDWVVSYQAATGGGGVPDWPAGWGTRPPLGSHHGIGQPFAYVYDSQGQLVWQPLRDYNEWLGRPANICKVWPNSSQNGIGNWDGIAGGAGSSDTTWAGQLAEANPASAFDPKYWPINRPVVLALTGVPLSHSNAQDSSTYQWGRPGIWSEIKDGTYDIYYQRLFRRLATKCGQTGRDPRTVVIRWLWEANGNWYTHSVGPDKTNFITAWRRCIDIMRASVSAVLGAGKTFLVEFGPSGHLRFGNGASERLWNMYPGDDWVDICGLGIHDQLGIKTQADWDKYLTYPTTIAGTPFEGILDWFDFAVDRGKWIGTSEIECNYNARTYFPKTQNMDVFWRTGFEVVRQRYPGKFVYFIYLWNGASSLKRPDNWGEPYRLLYR